jgi:hypothetical protein
MNDETLSYFTKQPSPSYINKKYYEWIKPFVNNVKGMLNLDKIDVKEFDKQV